MQYYGFGANAQFGSRIVRVTNLNDSGQGSFREALRQGSDIHIVFDVGGNLGVGNSLLAVQNNQDKVWIDGASAPAPGIRLVTADPSRPPNALLQIRGATNVVVTHLRGSENSHDVVGVKGVKDGSGNTIFAQNILIANCSMAMSGDGALDIIDGVRDMTVMFCLIGKTKKGMLINQTRAQVDRLSILYCYFKDTPQRSPSAGAGGLVEVVNCYGDGWSNYGLRYRNGAFGNVINNHYEPSNSSDPKKRARAIFIVSKNEPTQGSPSGPVFLSGNIVPPETLFSTDSSLIKKMPFITPVKPLLPASEVKAFVQKYAGALPRDSFDAGLVGTSSALPTDDPFATIPVPPPGPIPPPDPIPPPPPSPPPPQPVPPPPPKPPKPAGLDVKRLRLKKTKLKGSALITFDGKFVFQPESDGLVIEIGKTRYEFMSSGFKKKKNKWKYKVGAQKLKIKAKPQNTYSLNLRIKPATLNEQGEVMVIVTSGAQSHSDTIELELG